MILQFINKEQLQLEYKILILLKNNMLQLVEFYMFLAEEI